jgi:hypothetical protein
MAFRRGEGGDRGGIAGPNKFARRRHMSIPVFRTSDRATSILGKQITDNASLDLEISSGLWPPAVAISFATPQSSFAVLIQADSFKDLAALMMKANANEAVKAFGAAMHAGLDQRKRWMCLRLRDFVHFGRFVSRASLPGAIRRPDLSRRDPSISTSIPAV